MDMIFLRNNMVNFNKDHFSGYNFGFKTNAEYSYSLDNGLSEKIIREISAAKDEPKWMLEFRLKSFEIFKKSKLPDWALKADEVDLSGISFYQKVDSKVADSWINVPREIRSTFNRVGFQKAEKEYLGGAGAQFDSEMVYHSLRDELREQGVVFESTDVALKKYPEIFKKYFATVVPASDNKFAALNSAVWSGGSFIYVPKNVKVNMPLSAHFRMNHESAGQFERTLIIADEGSSIHYMEGCTAPTCTDSSLHSAVVEVVALKGASVQYTTIQNWSTNIYNLVTKRALVKDYGKMYWLDCNIGSKVTMKYPAIILQGKQSKGDIHSLAFAGENQYLDAGAKVIHVGDRSSSTVISKSICTKGGHSIYRGLVKILPSAVDVKNYVECDALLLDNDSISDTYPIVDVASNSSQTSHEAKVSKISEKQIFYLMSRGFSRSLAISNIVNGFANSIIERLPPEYAIEMTRLLELELIE